MLLNMFSSTSFIFVFFFGTSFYCFTIIQFYSCFTIIFISPINISNSIITSHHHNITQNVILCFICYVSPFLSEEIRNCTLCGAKNWGSVDRIPKKKLVIPPPQNERIRPLSKGTTLPETNVAPENRPSQ